MLFSETNKASLETFINILEPHIPDDLIGKEYIECFREIFRELPLVSHAVLERYFGEGQQRVDVNVCITGWMNEHATLYNWLEKKGHYHSAEEYSAFERIKQFCKLWSEDYFNLKLLIAKLWIVYDITDTSNKHIVPWHYVHFNVLPIFSENGSFTGELVFKILSLLNQGLHAPWQEKLRDIFTNLPPGFRISSVGVQESRSVQYLRLYITFTSFKELFVFLRTHHWQGNADELYAEIETFSENSNSFGLLADFGPGLQQRIGIEVWVNEKNDAVKKLIDKGWCTQAQGNAFSAWKGCIKIENKKEIWSWPDMILSSNNFPEHITIRKLHPYIKIIVEPGKPIMAKGYFTFDRFIMRDE